MSRSYNHLGGLGLFLKVRAYKGPDIHSFVMQCNPKDEQLSLMYPFLTSGSSKHRVCYKVLEVS